VITFYLNLRAQSTGGGVVDPRALQGNGDVEAPALLLLEDAAVRGLVAGRDVLFAVHGFATDQVYGMRMFSRLNAQLALPSSSSVFFGVLWPGDSWLPFVDYPFEGSFAMDAGTRLARYINIWMGAARSISFVSHSLGARVVLQTVTDLNRKTRLACLTAAAVNQSCLAEEYAAAIGAIETIAILASREDKVLQLAYPPGDAIADTLDHDHPYFEPALGYDGPPAPPPSRIKPPWQSPDGDGYDHSDYHPPGDDSPPTIGLDGRPRWIAVADFVARAYHGATQTWPTG
jgi:hypothetical protein